jgi:hypothetical protein
MTLRLTIPRLSVDDILTPARMRRGAFGADEMSVLAKNGLF